MVEAGVGTVVVEDDPAPAPRGEGRLSKSDDVSPTPSQNVRRSSLLEADVGRAMSSKSLTSQRRRSLLDNMQRVFSGAEPRTQPRRSLLDNMQRVFSGAEPRTQPRSQADEIMDMLDEQQKMLQRVLDRQDLTESQLHSQGRWICRQVVRLLSQERCLGKHESEADSPQTASNELGNYGSAGNELGPGNCGSAGTLDYHNRPLQTNSATLTAMNLAIPANMSPLWPSEVSKSSVSEQARDDEEESVFSTVEGSLPNTTPPEHAPVLDATLKRLRKAGKNVFFWGLSNSEDQYATRARGFSAVAYGCTHSVCFEVLVPIFIVANACLIGYQSDWNFRHMDEPGRSSDEVPAFRYTNRMFVAVFLVELLLRMVAEGRNFFRPAHKSFGWNMFDSFIVVSSVVEEILQLLLKTRHAGISSARVVRILRLVRALRVVRIMSFFRELRIMVAGIMNCGKSVLWAVLLITIMTYTFSVVFLQISFAWLQEQGISSFDGDRSSETSRSIDEHFSSLIGGMYTLFKAMSGGSSWGDVSDPLSEISPLVTIAFCVYIMLAVFVVLNVITAIFVDSAARVSGDEATRILDSIERKRVWIQNAKQLFKAIDTRGEGVLERKDINKLFFNERAWNSLQEFGIDLDFQCNQVLYNLFDASGKGIDEDQFAKTLYKLQGSARSLDLARIHNTVQSVHKSLKAVNRRVDTLASLMGHKLNRNSGAARVGRDASKD